MGLFVFRMERLLRFRPDEPGGAMSIGLKLVEYRNKKLVKDASPPLFDVVMINDDVTPYLFVVFMLIDDFCMSVEQAERAALTIHEDGSAIVMTTTREIAEDKASDAMSKARHHKFPLRIEVTPSPP